MTSTLERPPVTGSRDVRPPGQPRWKGTLVAAAAAALAGVLTGLAMPRGPLSSVAALLLILLGLVVGAVAGFAMRSRWAMLIAPVVHVAVFELVRLGETGPSVDAITFSNAYGVVAFVLGRGFYGLLALLPMVLGAAYAAGCARRHGPTAVAGPAGRLRRIGWRMRQGIAAVTALALVGLTLLLILPARVPPVLASEGAPVPGGIAELERVRLGGHDQWIEIRAASSDKPVLLYLSGGPGQSDLPFMRVFLGELARDFVVVGWDQRGTGKSYPSLDPDTLTLDRAVADTVELTDYLRQRFDEQKIYLVGESWGTTLGVLAVQQHPELYYAWIGSGQMVSQRETDRLLYDDVLAYADRTKDTGLARIMRGYGPPPYPDIWAYATVMSQYGNLTSDYDPPVAYQRLGVENQLYVWGMFQPEYTLVEKTFVLRGLIDMAARMYPQLQDIDFRRDVPRLDVPVYLLQGDHELTARSQLAEQWYAALSAPHKQIYRFADAGHSTVMEEFRAFHTLMLDTVLPATYPAH